jgi:hypothetical protein
MGWRRGPAPMRAYASVYVRAYLPLWIRNTIHAHRLPAEDSRLDVLACGLHRGLTEQQLERGRHKSRSARLW